MFQVPKFTKWQKKQFSRFLRKISDQKNVGEQRFVMEMSFEKFSAYFTRLETLHAEICDL